MVKHKIVEPNAPPKYVRVTQLGEYKGWRIYQFPLSTEIGKIAATKGPFQQIYKNGLTVHKDYPLAKRMAEVMAVEKVHEKIDRIEAEGYAHFVARIRSET